MASTITRRLTAAVVYLASASGIFDTAGKMVAGSYPRISQACSNEAGRFFMLKILLVNDRWVDKVESAEDDRHDDRGGNERFAKRHVVQVFEKGYYHDYWFKSSFRRGTILVPL